VSLLPSWLSVSSIIPVRFNPRSLTDLIILAAASTLAGPIPADSLSKKDIDIIREPETLDSGLEVIGRELEGVEARDPLAPYRGYT
jgi:hypothetical protein